MYGDNQSLPDYERPPVSEIGAAVQFLPLAAFGMAEVVSVAREFAEWRILDAAQAIPPIVEPPPGRPLTETISFGFGTPPLRLMMASEDERRVVQLQQDRVALHERRTAERPSFRNVIPKFREAVSTAERGLGRRLLAEEHSPELVELTYVNPVMAGEGWSSFDELDKVLRVVAGPAGTPPFEKVEQLTVAFSSVLDRQGDFAGRLRVQGSPRVAEDGATGLDLRLISRRYVSGYAAEDVLRECHRDVVRGFTAVTTPAMHAIWGRSR